MTCIICELNPLHNGHKYLIDKARDNGPVVLIMSGNFTQRGSAAVFDKYTRAKAAVKCGVDLVLELPFPWCSAGAADFARAGVSIAFGINADSLMFGSGSGDAELLERAGRAFAKSDFDNAFFDASKTDPAEGAAKLRDRILSEMFSPDEAAALSNPNDILGIEYYRYSHIAGGIDCIPVKRTEGGNVASATRIREIMISQNSVAEYIPVEAYEVFYAAVPVRENLLYDVERILYRMNKCRTDSAESEGGLGNRLRRSAGESLDGTDMLKIAATKKYTDARIRRAALFSVLGITRDVIREAPLYTTVLGIGKDGGKILKDIGKQGNIEVLTKAADFGKLSDASRMQFEISASADRLYTLLMTPNKSEEYFLSVTPYVEK